MIWFIIYVVSLYVLWQAIDLKANTLVASGVAPFHVLYCAGGVSVVAIHQGKGALDVVWRWCSGFFGGRDDGGGGC